MDIDRTAGAALQPEIALPQPANEERFDPVPTPVRLLTLDEGAKRVQRDHEALKGDELWQGDVYDPFKPDEVPIPIYLRVGPVAPLVAELLCAVVARALGLPAPEPFVVLVEPGLLSSSVLLDPTMRHLCVGTRDIGGTTFAQLLLADSATAVQLIKNWSHLVPVTALDEWLANPDRNMGNILYVAQTLHIIDHAEAFGGSVRKLFPLAEITEDALANKLALVLNDPNANQRQIYLNQAKEWLTFTAGQLNVSAVVAMAEISRWQTAEEEVELVHFITNRLTIAHRLLCNRLGHPQLALSI